MVVKWPNHSFVLFISDMSLVGSILSFVYVYQSRLPEKVKTPVHIQVWSWDLFSNFLTSVFDSALGITFIHAGILKEKGGNAVALSDSYGIDEILNYFVSGFSFSKCGRASGTFSTSLDTQFFQLIATFVLFGMLKRINKMFPNFPLWDLGRTFLFQNSNF